MSKLVILLFVHAGLGVALCLLIKTIKGSFAEKTYNINKKPWLQPWLMPGPLAKKENWIRYQKVLAWVALPILAVTYIGILWKVLLEP